MNALQIYAGAAALRHLQQHGLQPADVGVIAGAAGGPKGLILGPLDRFIFGQWLAQQPAHLAQPVHLVGASIGAWRMATACLPDAVTMFEHLEREYIRQHYVPPPGRRRPTPEQVSGAFRANLERFFGGRVAQALDHRRYRLHLIAARGKHLLAREARWRTPLGYLGAFGANLLHRRALGGWMERVVFSSAPEQLPFGTHDYPTRPITLTEANFMDALQASCSIPFAMQAVHDIAGAPRGAYWDGGLTDYHLHLHYFATEKVADTAIGTPIFDTLAVKDQNRRQPGTLVLYPHFQRAVVPGWMDKKLPWRHKSSACLERMVLLAPRPEWVARLPGGKLPDRTDFTRYAADLPARMRLWQQAVNASVQLAEEFEQWLRDPQPGGGRVLPL